MSRDHVSHADLVRFADERVNLKRDDAVDLRAQANGCGTAWRPIWQITGFRAAQDAAVGKSR